MSTPVLVQREWYPDEREKAKRVEWGPGPWQEEPDKIQWVDGATNLDCLIVRNHGGALCGYVGVPETHALYGVKYNEESPALRATLDARLEQYVDMSHLGLSLMLTMICGGDAKATPDVALSVHGGITFADHCDEPRLEEWMELRAELKSFMERRKDEMVRSPDGEAAEFAHELYRQSLMSYEAWLDYAQGRRICHVPMRGRPSNLWWLGFDCAHFGDFAPGYGASYRRLGLVHSERPVDKYRDRAYVEAEVASLARQLYTIHRLALPAGAS